jgi:hypothetical protein
MQTMKTIVLALSLVASVATIASAQSWPAAQGYFGNGSIGTDPDANVRFELRRDAPWQHGG